MQSGRFVPGEYTLRLKIDYAAVNPTLRDPVIYRVKERRGGRWHIFPTYDFAHCICDSIENVSYSLCTLEFEIRRDLYYHILERLGLYKPFVWEYARLNISHSLLSKRRLELLVQKRVVNGWDDERLMTLAGLRRRGVPPEAVLNFVHQIGISRTGNSGHVV